jgi:hypothetical protein
MRALRSFFSRQMQAFDRMFMPPFEGLWLGLLLYFAWGFFVHPDSQILRGNLPDSDDYMYLAQVLDWLKGQSWYDNVQHRLDGGTLIPFSRLPQLPMAALILFFEGLGLGPKGAATIMAMIEPLFLLAGLFLALRWVVVVFVPKNWAGISAYVLIFMGALMFLFSPGHIDHHGLDVLLVTLTLGCVFRMMMEPDKLLWGFGAGLLMALNLALALEILPWLIIISSVIVLFAIVKGGAAARNGLAYGLGLFLASVFFLAVTVRPANFFTSDLLSYSVVYILFTNSIALVLAGIAVVADDRPVWRALLGLSLGAATALLFFDHYPALLKGPFGGVDPTLATLMLNGLNESESLLLRGSAFMAIISTLSAWLALLYGILVFRDLPIRQRWPFGLLLVLILGCLGLSIFYQCRFISIMGMFAAIPLTLLLQRGWAWVGVHTTGRRKVWAEIGLLLLVGPLPGLLIPALMDGRSFNMGILLFSADSDAGSPAFCDMYGLENMLRDPKLFGDRPRLIMNTMDSGPELLFRTSQDILAAPFHTDVGGNLDAERFFSTYDPAEAEAIARKRHIELVTSCYMLPRIYVGIDAKGQLTDEKGGPVPTIIGPGAKFGPGSKFKPHFIQMLAAGRVPPWLRRVPMTVNANNYFLYEVVWPKRGADAAHSK